MKRIFTSLFFVVLMALVAPVQAQTVAMDFNQASCNGGNHHLFDELDSGQVVVISFVMMSCYSCIYATGQLKTIVAGFETTHPGKVNLYSFGYLNSYTCAQLNAWITSANFTHEIFSGGAAQTSYYGGMGMPTIVVLAGNTHSVLYRKLGYSASDKPAIISAIQNGLNLTTGLGENPVTKSYKVYPSIFSEEVHIQTKGYSSVSWTMTDLLGRKVLQGEVSDNGTALVGTSGLEKGIYLVNLYSAQDKLATVKVIKKD